MNNSITSADFLAAIVTLALFFSLVHLAMDSFIRSKRKELNLMVLVPSGLVAIYGLTHIFTVCLHTELGKGVYILCASALTVTMLKRAQLIKF